MKKKSAKSKTIVVVPNPPARSKRSLPAKEATKKKAQDSDVLSRAYEINLASKFYDLKPLSAGKTVVVVRDKGSGRTLSKFHVGTGGAKKAPVRKLALEPRAGTIPIKKILDAI